TTMSSSSWSGAVDAEVAAGFGGLGCGCAAAELATSAAPTVERPQTIAMAVPCPCTRERLLANALSSGKQLLAGDESPLSGSAAVSPRTAVGASSLEAGTICGS